MGKKRPVIEFKGLAGILGDSSSSATPTSNYTRPHRHSRRHRHRKSRRRYSRRKHFAADQRYHREKAERRALDDAEYLAQQMRRDQRQRSSLKDSVLAEGARYPAPPFINQPFTQPSHNQEYFERARNQTASVGYAHADQLHDGGPYSANGSYPPYSPQPPPPPPPPPDAPGSHRRHPPRSEHSRPQRGRAHRPHAERPTHSEQQHAEQASDRDEQDDHVEYPQGGGGGDGDDDDDDGDENGLLAGGRGLLRKFAKSNILGAVAGHKPRRKRTILGAVGAAAATAALVFAGKKYFDKRKEDNKEDEEQESVDAAQVHGAEGPFDSEGIYVGPNPLNLVPPPTKFSVKVPQNEAFIVERGGRFHRRLNAGSNALIPCLDHITFRYSLKESSIPIAWQECFTRDNVAIRVNGLLFIRVDDPVSASYEIDNAYHAITMLVQSCMKREFNRMTVEQAYTDRYHVDQGIKDMVNTASRAWGVRCTRFEVKQVELPEDLRVSLEEAAAAERKRREEVRQAEAQCEVMVKRAEAEMQLQMRRSQARQVDMVNQAMGEAHAISERSEAIANAMRDLADAVSVPNGEKAMQMRLAEQYLQAYGQIAGGGAGVAGAPDPRHVASTMNNAIELLNTLGQPSCGAHSAYVFPETNPFEGGAFEGGAVDGGAVGGGVVGGGAVEGGAGIGAVGGGSVLGGTASDRADAAGTAAHGQVGVATPDMSQTTVAGGAGGAGGAGRVAAYPQGRQGLKGALKDKSAQLLNGVAQWKAG